MRTLLVAAALLTPLVWSLNRNHRRTALPVRELWGGGDAADRDLARTEAELRTAPAAGMAAIHVPARVRDRLVTLATARGTSVAGLLEEFAATGRTPGRTAGPDRA
ncbi:hypothetical protein [Streptomyces carpaticus]|uniref:hypothetical protein n=1 Tax=Streptomyces carpaticus TaxID=285558 RepID=UPI0031F8E03C